MFIVNRNFNGWQGELGYHDPVYDPSGGQGAASTPAPVQDPTFLYLAIALVVFLILQDE